MMVGEGDVRFCPAAELREPVVQYGEYRDGKWHALVTEARRPSIIRIRGRGALRSALALVSDQDALPQGVTKLEALLSR